MTAPIEPAKAKGHFHTKVAAQRELDILNCIGWKKKTKVQLMRALGLEGRQVGFYLKRMVGNGVIHVTGTMPGGRGNPAHIYARGPKPDWVPAESPPVEEEEEVEQRVILPQSWCSALFARQISW